MTGCCSVDMLRYLQTRSTPKKAMTYPNLTRRRFMHYAAGATGLCLGFPAPAGQDGDRSLTLHNLHTGESLRSTYWVEGHAVEQELAALNRLLRDHRTGEVYPIDIGVLDILWTLQRAVDSSAAYEVISGYRSPKTNAKLNAAGRGVAKRSLHMQGRAIDVRLVGTDTLDLKRAAIGLKAGGVGYYRKSDFVHLDTGRFRTW